MIWPGDHGGPQPKAGWRTAAWIIGIGVVALGWMIGAALLTYSR